MRRQIVAVHQHLPPRRLRQPAHHIQQSGFAAARRAHHGHEFPGQNLEIHAPQRRHLHLAGAICLPKIFGLEYWFQLCVPAENRATAGLGIVAAVAARGLAQFQSLYADWPGGPRR